jgi:hypothetical protein
VTYHVDELRVFAEWIRDVEPDTTTWNRAKAWAAAALAAAPSPEEDFDPVPYVQGEPYKAAPSPGLDVEVLAQVLEESGVASMTSWWDEKAQKQHIEFDWHEHALRLIAAYENRLSARLRGGDRG